MTAKMIFYHGSAGSKPDFAEDQKKFEHFICRIPNQDTESVFILPENKALSKPYYWTGMAQISKLESIGAVGLQTDLSVSIGKGLKLFDMEGGQKEKLRLCAIFQPEHLTLSKFLSQCQKLIKENISFSVCVYGLPENLNLIKELRTCLPADIYLWIAPADRGLPYAPDDQAEFETIDPFFLKEADEYFGRFPLFRIPWKPKAFFFYGDNVPYKELKGETSVLLSALKRNRETAPLFIITSLSHQEASRHFHNILPLCTGGIFSGGAHIFLNRRRRQPFKEEYRFTDSSLTPVLEHMEAKYGCRLRISEEKAMVYKFTLEKPSSRLWREEELNELKRQIPPEHYNCIMEGSCLHIVSSKADITNGIRTISRWLSVPEESCVILDEFFNHPKTFDV